jgi:hypothetical protein
MSLPDNADDSFQIVFAQTRSARQAQAALENAFGNRAATLGTVSEHRLQMQRFPNRTRFDIRRFEGQTHLFARAAETRWIEGDAGEPIVRVPVARLRHEIDSGLI